MQEFAMFLGLVLLWSIARSLSRIVRLIETVEITVDITGGGGFDPEKEMPQKRPDDIIAFGMRRAS
jgi:hypothetical protein